MPAERGEERRKWDGTAVGMVACVTGIARERKVPFDFAQGL